ncbi:MAG TPA: peptidylprolyl isomerase [Rhizomicrobium sp.]
MSSRIFIVPLAVFVAVGFATSALAEAPRLPSRNVPQGATAAAQTAKPGIEPLLNENSTDGVAAVVNDSIISDYDLRQRVALFVATSGVRPNAENLKAIRQQVLSQVETERLELLEAQRKNISVSTSEVDKAIDNIMQDNHLAIDQMKKLFAASNVDMATFRGQIAAQIAWTKTVQDEYGDRANVSSTDVDEEFKRIASGANKPHFRVAEIFEAVDSPEQDAQVLKNMQGLLQQIRAGAPFEAVARQFSQNPTAASGGDVGIVQEGQLVPELDAALHKMHTGEVSEPIKASGGYYLLFLRLRVEPVGTKLPQTPVQPQGEPGTLPLARVLLPIGPKPPKALLQNAMQAANILRQNINGCDRLQELVTRMKGAVYFNLGRMQLSLLSPEIRNALAQTHEGEPAQPFQSAAGIELIVRCDKAPPKLEVFHMPGRDEVEQQLYEDQMAVYARRYLRDLRRVANIESAEDRALKHAKSSASR